MILQVSGKLRQGKGVFVPCDPSDCAVCAVRYHCSLSVVRCASVGKRVSGERTGNSLNQKCYGIFGVVGLQRGLLIENGSCLESSIIEGDNPVHEFD